MKAAVSIFLARQGRHAFAFAFAVCVRMPLLQSITAVLWQLVNKTRATWSQSEKLDNDDGNDHA